MNFNDPKTRDFLEKEWQKSILKNYGNGLFLSQEEVVLLQKYNLSYQESTSMKEFMYQIENVLSYCEEEDYEELEQISTKISDFYYYNYVKK